MSLSVRSSRTEDIMNESREVGGEFGAAVIRAARRGNAGGACRAVEIAAEELNAWGKDE